MKISAEELVNYPEVPLGTARNLTGMRQGRLEALYRTVTPPYIKSAGTYWLCKCDCGNYAVTLGTNFSQGKVKSCGCLSKETSRELMKNIRKIHPEPWNKKDLTG